CGIAAGSPRPRWEAGIWSYMSERVRRAANTERPPHSAGRRSMLRNPTVYMWPKRSPHNKYSELLSGAIERGGFRVVHYDRSTAFRPRRGDIVHLHWPHNSYRGRNLPLTLAKSLSFAALLLYYWIIGVRLFWTVHNVWPHTGKTR